MEVDYSNHMMTDWMWIDQYKEQLGKEKFDKFLDMVYGWLMNLKPGQSIDIIHHEKITERNRDLVIKVCCLFISSDNYGYQFTNDFTKITNNSYAPRTGKTETRKNLEKQGKGVSV